MRLFVVYTTFAWVFMDGYKAPKKLIKTLINIKLAFSGPKMLARLIQYSRKHCFYVKIAVCSLFFYSGVVIFSNFLLERVHL